MFAIIQAGGRQYRVREGDVIEVDRVPAEIGDEVVFDRVLAVQTDEDLRVGQPVLEGCRAVGRVLAQGRGRKIRVFKYKPKSNYRRRSGHRQPFTQVRIEHLEA